MDVHALNVLSRCNSNPLYFIILTRNRKMSQFAYFSDSRIAPHTRLSQIHFARNLPQINIYIYIISNYCHTHKDRLVLYYPFQNSICDIPSSKSQNRFLKMVPAQSFPLFLFTLSIKLHIRNHHCAPNSL